MSTLGASSLWQGKGQKVEASRPSSRSQHTLEAGKGLRAEGSLGLLLQANPSSSAWQWLCEPQTEVPSSSLAMRSLAASISPGGAGLWRGTSPPPTPLVWIRPPLSLTHEPH